ncbi:armadillo-type protein [Lipomyces japonicus]|uniref:armadillo-type protein n=1 Tax=Lipomyces japonicus TaxID=56871 RepID=UPI0034CD62E9
MTIAPVDLLNVLHAATLQEIGSEQARLAAEQQLKNWEIQAGFYSLLQDAFIDESLSIEIRWLAIIYFKNGIEKYWRRSAPHAISKEEKNDIRRKIRDTITVTSPQLVAQNALAIAKISRIDFPVEWPSLFSDLVKLANEAHESGNLARLNSILVVLNQIVKVICSTRFGKTRSALQQATPDLVRFIGQWYVTYTNIWMNALATSTNDTNLQSSIGYLSLKICRHLVVEGYEFANRQTEAREFFETASFHLKGFIDAYRKIESSILEQHIKTLGKIFSDLCERQPTAFLLMPQPFEVVAVYMSILESQAEVFHQKQIEGNEFWERLVIRGLLLLRKCIKIAFGDGTVTIKYRTPQDREETKSAINLVKVTLFTDDFAIQVHDILLRSYLRLRPTDLQLWLEEPEQFVYDESQNSWEYQLRPCAERVYVDLLLNFKVLLRPRFLQIFDLLSTTSDQSDDAILAKDAVYCAFSVGANALFDDVKFDSIFTKIFEREVMDSNLSIYPMQRIILRRIAHIISNWVSVNCGPSIRKNIYEVLVKLTDSSDQINDLVVQLSAAAALRCAVDEWDFKFKVFLPFLKLFLDRFLQLMGQVQMIETKLSLLQVISVIVEVADSNIFPFADEIMGILPVLWDQSGEEHMLKGAILQALTNIIRAVGRESSKFHSRYTNLITTISDPTSDMHLYLMEDALELWQVTVEKTPVVTEEILSLLPVLLKSLDQATDNLKIELAILEAYVLLTPAYVVKNYGQVVFSILTSFIGNLKVEANYTVTHIIELFIEAVPMQDYISDFVSTRLLLRMTDAIFDPHESSINVTRFLTIYSRLAILDIQVIIQFIDIYSTQRPSHADGRSYLGLLLDVWTEKIENMGHPRARKLTALALDSFLHSQITNGREEVVSRAEKLARAKEDILAELEGEDVEVSLNLSRTI